MIAVIAIAMVGAGASRATTPAKVAAANRALAIRIGDGLLADVSLPSDATPAAVEPSGDRGELARGLRNLWYRAQVDLVRFWLTAATPSQVLSSITASPPAGASSQGRGWVGGPDLETFQSWSMPTIDPARLGQRLITVTAAKLTSGKTGVRADAWVQYLAPRPTGQRVPTRARVLDITVTGSPAGKLVWSLRVTNGRTVRRIAAVVDGLPFAGEPNDVAISCPGFLGNTRVVTFRFRASRTGAPLATVNLYADTPASADPCVATSLWIHGQRQPPLANGGLLLTHTDAILRVKLADPAVLKR